MDGVRADRVVSALAGVSRSVSRRWCDQGLVRVDGSIVSASSTVREGQHVAHPDPPEREALAADPTVPFSVVHEDDDVAVLDKPAGVVVHPGAGRTTGTLAAGILARWPQVEGVGQAGRWGIVHRLDRETSGLLVVALNESAYRGLTGALAARRVERVYWAGVRGLVASETGTIDAPIRRDPQRPIRMAVHRSGRPARTHYRRLGAVGTTDQLLEVVLETGRTHQIRVHLARIGHPILGDRLYGWRGSGWADRIWLHARRLSFEHPITGIRIVQESDLPEDLRVTLGPQDLPDIRP